MVLHGDVHTGNARISFRRGQTEAVLLDWARIRTGSPFEDVCSWLESVGFWASEPKRRHDTLLRCYLAGRGLSSELGPGLRELYGIAGASNALAGALRYHSVDRRYQHG